MKQHIYRSIKRIHLAGFLVLAGFILAACQTAIPIPVTSATEIPTEVSLPTSAPTATSVPALPEPTLQIATDPVLGKILVDDKGMTLYIFTKDEAGKSNCDSACLSKWPPLLTNGSPKAGEGVDDGQLGSALLDDGRQIVTYNQMPLYYWVNDLKAGDTSGQNVGSVWFVVNPDGKPVMAAANANENSNSSDNSNDGSDYSSDDYGKGNDNSSADTSMEPTINVATDPKLGKILVDGNGMTLYLFTKDTPGQSNCSGNCLAAWPPLLTKGNPILGPGVDPAKVESAKLADGSLIVTYDGMPLYYYVSDIKAGDTTGQGVGGVWYIVAP